MYCPRLQCPVIILSVEEVCQPAKSCPFNSRYSTCITMQCTTNCTIFSKSQSVKQSLGKCTSTALKFNKLELWLL